MYVGGGVVVVVGDKCYCLQRERDNHHDTWHGEPARKERNAEANVRLHNRERERKATTTTATTTHDTMSHQPRRGEKPQDRKKQAKSVPVRIGLNGAGA